MALFPRILHKGPGIFRFLSILGIHQHFHFLKSRLKGGVFFSYAPHIGEILHAAEAVADERIEYIVPGI